MSIVKDNTPGTPSRGVVDDRQRYHRLQYDTAVEDLVDILVAVTDGFNPSELVGGPGWSTDTKERIFDEAVARIQAERCP